jgi:hypothetical protein
MPPHAEAIVVVASHRARSVTATMAQAEALADLVRDHGLPARVVVGRKRGGIRIRAAMPRRPTRSGVCCWRSPVWLPVDRAAVLEWLGY